MYLLVVTISFLEDPYVVPEDGDSVTVVIGIDRDIVRPLTFDVSGSKHYKAKKYN